MTKKEKQQVEQAIKHLMSTEEEDGFNVGLDLLLKLVGRYRPVNRMKGKVVSIWELKNGQE